MERIMISLTEVELQRLDAHIQQVRQSGWATRSGVIRDALAGYLVGKKCDVVKEDSGA